jgi:hypothetical protein
MDHPRQVWLGRSANLDARCQFLNTQVIPAIPSITLIEHFTASEIILFMTLPHAQTFRAKELSQHILPLSWT